MPFDPTKPSNNSPNSSAEMRGQLTSLNADIQQRATLNDLNAAINLKREMDVLAAGEAAVDGG